MADEDKLSIRIETTGAAESKAALEGVQESAESVKTAAADAAPELNAVSEAQSQTAKSGEQATSSLTDVKNALTLIGAAAKISDSEVGRFISMLSRLASIARVVLKPITIIIAAVGAAFALLSSKIVQHSKEIQDAADKAAERWKTLIDKIEEAKAAKAEAGVSAETAMRQAGIPITPESKAAFQAETERIVREAVVTPAEARAVQTEAAQFERETGIDVGSRVELAQLRAAGGIRGKTSVDILFTATQREREFAAAQARAAIETEVQMSTLARREKGLTPDQLRRAEFVVQHALQEGREPQQSSLQLLKQAIRERFSEGRAQAAAQQINVNSVVFQAPPPLNTPAPRAVLPP